MKTANSVNVERQALEAITGFLSGLPNLEVDQVERDDVPSIRRAGIDFLVHGRFGNKTLLLAVEVKASGQPRHVQDAAFRLQRYRREFKI